MKYLRKFNENNETPKDKCNSYEFIWWDYKGKIHTKIIKEKNIDAACKKFSIPKTMVQIDYEVQCNDSYIDISNKEKFKKFI
jgi:ribosomal protein S26